MNPSALSPRSPKVREDGSNKLDSPETKIRCAVTLKTVTVNRPNHGHNAGMQRGCGGPIWGKISVVKGGDGTVTPVRFQP